MVSSSDVIVTTSLPPKLLILVVESGLVAVKREATGVFMGVRTRSEVDVDLTTGLGTVGDSGETVAKERCPEQSLDSASVVFDGYLVKSVAAAPAYRDTKAHFMVCSHFPVTETRRLRRPAHRQAPPLTHLLVSLETPLNTTQLDLGHR